MKTMSTVGLTAIEINTMLHQNKIFTLTHFRNPLALVVKIPRTKRELMQLCEVLKRELFDETQS